MVLGRHLTSLLRNACAAGDVRVLREQLTPDLVFEFDYQLIRRYRPVSVRVS
jgi:hypothetical protein